MMKRLLLAAALVSLTILGGCGGSGGSDAGTGTGGSASGSSSSASSGSGGSESSAGGSTTAFCTAARSWNKVEQAYWTKFSSYGGLVPASFAGYMRKTVPVITSGTRAMTAAAPSAIKAAMQKYDSAWSSLAALYTAADYNFASMDTAQLGAHAKELAGAAKPLLPYLKKNCQITVVNQ